MGRHKSRFYIIQHELFFTIFFFFFHFFFFFLVFAALAKFFSVFFSRQHSHSFILFFVIPNPWMNSWQIVLRLIHKYENEHDWVTWDVRRGSFVCVCDGKSGLLSKRPWTGCPCLSR